MNSQSFHQVRKPPQHTEHPDDGDSQENGKSLHESATSDGSLSGHYNCIPDNFHRWQRKSSRFRDSLSEEPKICCEPRQWNDNHGPDQGQEKLGSCCALVRISGRPGNESRQRLLEPEQQDCTGCNTENDDPDGSLPGTSIRPLNVHG